MERELINRIVEESERERKTREKESPLSRLATREVEALPQKQGLFFQHLEINESFRLEHVVRKVVKEELDKRLKQ